MLKVENRLFAKFLQNFHTLSYNIRQERVRKAKEKLHLNSASEISYFKIRAKKRSFITVKY